MSCHFCYNAHVWAKELKTEENYFDEGLDDNNDGSSCSIGKSRDEFSIMFNSGMGKPCEIEFRNWFSGQWHTIGYYYPKFCPECGRPLDEYIIGERGQSFDRKKESTVNNKNLVAVDSEGNEIDFAILDNEFVVEEDKHKFINSLRHETGCSYLICMDAYDYMKRRNGTKDLAIAYLKVKQLGPNSKKTFDERVLDYLKDMQVQGK